MKHRFLVLVLKTNSETFLLLRDKILTHTLPARVIGEIFSFFCRFPSKICLIVEVNSIFVVLFSGL